MVADDLYLERVAQYLTRLVWVINLQPSTSCHMLSGSFLIGEGVKEQSKKS